VFDLLHLDGIDLRRVRLIDRKRVLKLLRADLKAPVTFSDHLKGDSGRRAAAASVIQGRAKT
jgi:bifunctional non-homologous end joining protein LigD